MMFISLVGLLFYVFAVDHTAIKGLELLLSGSPQNDSQWMTLSANDNILHAVTLIASTSIQRNGTNRQSLTIWCH